MKIPYFSIVSNYPIREVWDKDSDGNDTNLLAPAGKELILDVLSELRKNGIDAGDVERYEDDNWAFLFNIDGYSFSLLSGYDGNETLYIIPKIEIGLKALLRGKSKKEKAISHALSAIRSSLGRLSKITRIDELPT